MSEDKTISKPKAIISSRSIKQYRFNKLHLLVTAGLISLVGVTFLVLSLADSFSLATSTNPNDVIVQYSLPHMAMPVNTAALATPMAVPFTLYGNGTLVCGYGADTSAFMPPMPGMSSMQMNMPGGNNPAAATSTTLSPAQIKDLIQKIYNTGYFQLKHEYFKLPIIEHQDILRVSTLSTNQYVLYYQDVSAPAAYTAVLSLLQNYCQNTTTPYVSSNDTLRVLKSATVGSSSVSAVSSLNSTVQNQLHSILPSVNTKFNSLKSHVVKPNTSSTTPYEVDQTISQGDAKQLIVQFKGKRHTFVNDGGANYELGLEPQLPKINNPLSINYSSLRASEKNNSLSSRIKRAITPSAYAATGNEPVRVVLLLPQGGGSTNALSEAQTLGSAVQQWYCGQVGACYNYQGVSVMTGSQTAATYMAGGYDPLDNVLVNVSNYDYGTVALPGVDTLVVTGWPTNEFSYGNCGYGFTGSLSNGVGLGVVDLTEPTISSSPNTFCQPGHDIAHELGHTFGLNHTGNGTLMDGTPYAQYAPTCDINNPLETTCTLDSGQATTLKADSLIFAPTGQTLNSISVNIQAADQEGNPISGVEIDFSQGASNMPYCQNSAATSRSSALTDNTGVASIICYMYGSTGSLQIGSISIPSPYSISSTSSVNPFSTIPLSISGGITQFYGKGGLNLINPYIGTATIQITNDKGGHTYTPGFVYFYKNDPTYISTYDCTQAWATPIPVSSNPNEFEAIPDQNGNVTIGCTINSKTGASGLTIATPDPLPGSSLVHMPTVTLTAGQQSNYLGTSGIVFSIPKPVISSVTVSPSPFKGAMTGPIKITADASSGYGPSITNVSFKATYIYKPPGTINGRLTSVTLGSSSAAPYQASWNVPKLNAQVTITATATNSAGATQIGSTSFYAGIPGSP